MSSTPPDPSAVDDGLAALRFALAPRPGPGVRLGRALAAALRHPSEAAAILKARLLGKRVRARQAAAALLGLDHHRLVVRAPPAPVIKAPPAPTIEAPPALAIEAPPALAGDAPPDFAAEDRPAATIVVPAAALGRAPLGPAEIVVLTAPGHTLLPGAGTRFAAGFAADPALQALYGDAVVLGAGVPGRAGSAMPLLRPAFDPDYLMAVDYIGPVVAFRRAALEAVGGLADPPAEAPALDLLLRVARRFGPSAIGHIARTLSAWRPPPAGEGARHPRGPRLALIRRHLSESGEAATGVAVDAAGLVGLIRPLPDPAPLVTLIVPTRDRLDLLRPCIESLLHRTDWPSREILICDNGSREPGTLAYLRDLEARGAARVVACPGPFDFAGMNNAAARAAAGRLLAFVNNDVEATDPGWLARLVREALRPDVGAVGARLLDRQGRIQHGGVVLGPGGLVTHAHRFFPGDAPGYLAALSVTRAVSAVTAACLVVETDKFARVGGFDAEAFAVDFNDVDLCLRLNAAGYRTLFVGGAVLNHYEAASRRWNAQSRARHGREVEAFRRRWGPLLAQDPHYHPGFDPDLGTYARLRPGWPDTGPVAPR